MKKLNVDLVQVTTIAGSLLTLIGGVLTANANEKKLDKTIEEKVAEALAKQINNKID